MLSRSLQDEIESLCSVLDKFCIGSFPVSESKVKSCYIFFGVHHIIYPHILCTYSNTSISTNPKNEHLK